MAKRGLVLPIGLLLLVIAATVWYADGKLLAQEPSRIVAPVAEGSNAADDLTKQLRDLDGNVFSPDEAAAKGLPQMLGKHVRHRIQVANLLENLDWVFVSNRANWERFRDVRLKALRESLGRYAPAPQDLKVRITGTLQGDGYRIDNLVFESRPGLLVTANLYAPANPPRSMPGIVIAHSHHNSKTQGELQDMGMTWARQGCLVLIPDELGHGERRQHPFRSEKDYPNPFRVGRQDYYFRYNTGLQLQLVGDSLMGWMAWDLMRCVDLLLSRPGIDKEHLVLLGSVAGGGDQAAVTAALDPRITAVAPFNFGGPQPDYAIPANPERDFYYFGVAYWESTRCLRCGARDRFPQWFIVASVAPRRLIYGHEFAWDEEHDPVWPRLKKVFAWYDAADHLAVAGGRGSLKGSPPESSHANNVGPLHRSKIYPSLQRWFEMPIPEEYSKRRTADELLCLTPEAAREFNPRPLHELAAALGADRAAEARQRRANLSLAEQRKKLRQEWGNLLGDVEPKGDPKLLWRKQEQDSLMVERTALEVETDVVVPVLLLVPPPLKHAVRPPAVVLGLAQDGKQAFLKHRSEEIAELLNGGVAVCLLDVRGTGETRPADSSRGRTGTAIDLSATEWLLGHTLVGSRLRDVRSVLRYLRGRKDLDASRIGLWGDSFAPSNPPDANLAVPLDAEPFPKLAEPLGGLLALFGALYEDDVRAVSIRGGLASYGSMLQSPFCYIPHDAVIPGAVSEGDLCDVAAALAPHPLRMDQMVDGLDRVVSGDDLAKMFATTRAAYRSLQAEGRLHLGGGAPPDVSPGRWMLRALQTD